MVYYELFKGAWNNSVPTFTFDNVKGNGLSFKSIAKLNKNHIILKNSILTIGLEFSKLIHKNIILDGESFTVVYSINYPNMRFIPVKEHKMNKHLLELFEESNRNKLENMFV